MLKCDNKEFRGKNGQLDGKGKGGHALKYILENGCC